MSLHKGLVWLADGFEKHDKLANTIPKHPVTGESGDAAYTLDSNPAHRLLFAQYDHGTGGRPQRVKSAGAVRIHPKAAAAADVRRKSIHGPPTNKHSHKNLPLRHHKAQRPSVTVTVPANMTPRVGAWTGKTSIQPCVDQSRKGSHRRVTRISDLSTQYIDLPTHPDLRYFDRHSRCFDHSHSSNVLTRARPHTACHLGKSSINQCGSCGEVTSQIRYSYAPTGSAMTEMNAGNKTFLYPEKILAYDSYTGRRRPSSAPSFKTVS